MQPWCLYGFRVFALWTTSPFDSNSVASVGSAASRCRAGPHERVGVTAKRQKRVCFLHYGGPLAHIESILSAVKRIRLGQSLTVKQFQRLLGLMAAASNVIPFKLLYIRPLQWWLRTKGFSPRGNPYSHDQGHAANLSCLGNVEETLVPVPGSRVGSFMLSQDANDRCLSHGLGSDLRGTLESGSVEGPASFMAHQPSGVVGCISCSQEFPGRPQGPPCACPLRQHIGGLLRALD